MEDFDDEEPFALEIPENMKPMFKGLTQEESEDLVFKALESYLKFLGSLSEEDREYYESLPQEERSEWLAEHQLENDEGKIE